MVYFFSDNHKKAAEQVSEIIKESTPEELMSLQRRVSEDSDKFKEIIESSLKRRNGFLRLPGY